ncbi:hypothetical protein PQX77_009592 [Marasmius sp. AFHP31]|nr:hypothetical protein PQX77_009592 [Marasmius sp. AFHP31]
MPKEVPPAYSRASAADVSAAVLEAISGSRQQEFVKEIKEIGDNIQESLDLTERLNSLLVEEDVRVNKVNKFASESQAESWKIAREVSVVVRDGAILNSRTGFKGYKAGIRAFKETVADQQTVAVQPFVKIWSTLAEQGLDKDVVVEFKNFSEKKLTNINQPVVSFHDMHKAIETVTEDFAAKLTNAKLYDVKIKKLIEEIAGLTNEMKSASEEIEKMIPSFFKSTGLNGYSERLTLLLACGPISLARSLIDVVTGLWDREIVKDNNKDNKGDIKGNIDGNDKTKVTNDSMAANKEGPRNGNTDMTGADRTGERPARGVTKDDLKRFETAGKSTVPIKALWDAIDIVEGCEKNIKAKRTELDKLEYQQERSQNNQGRWHVGVSILMKLQGLISHLEPKLGSVSKIGNAVKHTVDDYVKFLESADAKYPERKKAALAEIALARGLYQLVDKALGNFYTMPARTPRVSVMSK